MMLLLQLRIVANVVSVVSVGNVSGGIGKSSLQSIVASRQSIFISQMHNKRNRRQKRQG